MDAAEALAFGRRNPRAVLATMKRDGTSQLSPVLVGVEPLMEYYRSISGEHPDWDDYRAAMIKQGRCLIRITPTKAGPTVFG
jgi:hypothetical protein